jgi:hypothetical protein
LKLKAQVATNMKLFFKIFISILAGINIVFYLFTISEGKEVLNLKGSFFKVFFGTIKYYFTWVIPYWWFIILIVALVLSLLLFVVNKKIKLI